MEIWLSVIIPVYNCEKYVKKAVDSILKQDTAGVEIIIVDDGSTDNSYSICKQLAGDNSQIKVFHSENRGVSHARNLGMSRAAGEWIAFLDADDYFLDSAIDVMKKYASTKENIIVFSYRKSTDETKSLAAKEEKVVLNREEAINALLDFTRCRQLLPSDMILQYSLLTSCWGKLYRKSFADASGAAFQETLTLSEDMCFNLTLFKKAPGVLVVNYDVYCYYNNPESVTHSFSEKKFIGREKLVAYLGHVNDIPPECEASKQKYILVTILELAEKIGTAKNAGLKKRYISLLKTDSVAKCVNSNKIDKPLSAGKKQNFYYNIQFWLIKHRMYNLIPLLGYMYAKVRGQKV